MALNAEDSSSSAIISVRSTLASSGDRTAAFGFSRGILMIVGLDAVMLADTRLWTGFA
jgi:hypothetical protein